MGLVAGQNKADALLYGDPAQALRTYRVIVVVVARNVREQASSKYRRDGHKLRQGAERAERKDRLGVVCTSKSKIHNIFIKFK